MGKVKKKVVKVETKGGGTFRGNTGKGRTDR